MKKLFLFVLTGCLFFTTLSVNAQTEFKPFRVDVGLGYAICDGGGGVLLNFEPKYAVIPELSVGVKFELDLIVRDLQVTPSGDIATGTAQAMASYLATADYHLSKNTFRPFVGAGLGIYQIASASATTTSSGTNDADVDGRSNFGAMLRAGFDVSHFRLVLAYNFAGKDALDNNTGFFSITAGAYIGGGKVK